jgi:plasmid replication initiation protein
VVTANFCGPGAGTNSPSGWGVSKAAPSIFGIPLERDQLDLFRALPGDLAPRDAQDLMAYPFFSLAKSKRVAPDRLPQPVRRSPSVSRPCPTRHGDDLGRRRADLGRLADRRGARRRLKTSRLMAATPYEILTFVGRGTGRADYDRLKAALDRLQSTTVADLDPPAHRAAAHRFSWINEWKETADAHGRPLGLELILPDWFYAGVLDDALVLTIDRAYFDLTGGLERWLYRLVRKHGGRQATAGASIFPHLHAKSGSLSPLKHFAYDVREIVRRQPLPGYRLTIEQPASGPNAFPSSDRSGDPSACPRRRRSNTRSGDKL